MKKQQFCIFQITYSNPGDRTPYGIYVDGEQTAACPQYDSPLFKPETQYYKQCSTLTVRYLNNSSVCIKTQHTGTEQLITRQASSFWGLVWIG